MKAKKPLLKSIGLILCIIVGIMAVSTFAFYLCMKAPEGNSTVSISNPKIDYDNDDSNQTGSSSYNSTSPQQSKPQAFSFLVAGQDKVSGSTDSIMLIHLDISSKNINILNIPRDTMLSTDRQSKKINASYNIGGIEQFEKDVSSLTGFYVNRYMLFNIEAVEKIIDAIGGIDFDIPVNMNYEDPTQNLYIHFKKGYQHLYGEDVVKVARFRSYPDGDIGRINVQQELLKTLAEQAVKAENILKITEIVKIITENVQTDISFSEMLWLANEAKDIKVSNIETDMVPGVSGTIDNLSYWLPYKNELLDLINNRYNPLDKPITENDIYIVNYSENKEG